MSKKITSSPLLSKVRDSGKKWGKGNVFVLRFPQHFILERILTSESWWNKERYSLAKCSWWLSSNIAHDLYQKVSDTWISFWQMRQLWRFCWGMYTHIYLSWYLLQNFSHCPLISFGGIFFSHLFSTRIPPRTCLWI